MPLPKGVEWSWFQCSISLSTYAIVSSSCKAFLPHQQLIQFTKSRNISNIYCSFRKIFIDVFKIIVIAN